MGKALHPVNNFLRLRAGIQLPPPGNSLPAMPTRKRSALELLAENLAVWMQMPGNEGVSTGPKLAAKAGVSRKSVNNALKKRHAPHIDIVEKLARALKCETWQLLTPVEDRQAVIVLKAYSVSDARGREFLLDTAVTLISKSEQRAKDSEANRA